MIFKSKKPIDPSLFKLRIAPYGNSDFICFEYTIDGEKWEMVHCANSPFLGGLMEDWKWSPLIYRLYPDSTFKHEMNNFSSYEKLKAYEAAQYKKFLEGNKKQEKERTEYHNKMKNKIDSLNGN